MSIRALVSGVLIGDPETRTAASGKLRADDKDGATLQVSFHRIANLFPLLEGEEFDALVKDIAEQGVLEPVWLYEGQILDGRNRWRASQAAGVECPSREYVGTDPVGFVISLNLKRRHLNTSQRAMIAARLVTMTQGRQPNKGPNSAITEVSQRNAANILNVGRTSVREAAKLQSAAPEGVLSAVERGEITMNLADQFCDLPMDIQEGVLATIIEKDASARKLLREAIKTAHVSNNNGDNEWYTPSRFIELARWGRDGWVSWGWGAETLEGLAP